MRRGRQDQKPRLRRSRGQHSILPKIDIQGPAGGGRYAALGVRNPRSLTEQVFETPMTRVLKMDHPKPRSVSHSIGAAERVELVDSEPTWNLAVDRDPEPAGNGFVGRALG